MKRYVRRGAVGCLVMAGAFICWAQSGKNFGEKTWLKGSLHGQIFFLPTNTSRLPDLKTLKPQGSIFTRELNVPPRNWQAGFPGITNRFEWFAIEYTGHIRPAARGHFVMRLVS